LNKGTTENGGAEMIGKILKIDVHFVKFFAIVCQLPHKISKTSAKSARGSVSHYPYTNYNKSPKDMKIQKFRFVLAAICLASFLPLSQVSAAPVQFNEVVQFVSAKPGKASTGSFSRLGLVTDNTGDVTSDDDDDKKKKQDGRVITTTTTEVVEDEDCDCVIPEGGGGGFPKWALLGLAAIPIAIILIRRKKDTPTPTTTPSIPITTTPTATPGTPTPTPGTPTPTMTPPTSPTPPEPVPEPMTILLFGTGLAGIGMAARKRFGKKAKKEGDEE
jgi:hypothetical protein